MTIQSRMITNGIPGVTQRIASSDTSQRLSTIATLTLTADTTKTCTGVLITVETNPIRIAFSTAAVQTVGSEVGHPVGSGSSYFISGGNEAINAYFINQTNGSNGILQVTPYFE